MTKTIKKTKDQIINDQREKIEAFEHHIKKLNGDLKKTKAELSNQCSELIIEITNERKKMKDLTLLVGISSAVVSLLIGLLLGFSV